MTVEAWVPGARREPRTGETLRCRRDEGFGDRHVAVLRDARCQQPRGLIDRGVRRQLLVVGLHGFGALPRDHRHHFVCVPIVGRVREPSLVSERDVLIVAFDVHSSFFHCQ